MNFYTQFPYLLTYFMKFGIKYLHLGMFSSFSMKISAVKRHTLTKVKR